MQIGVVTVDGRPVGTVNMNAAGVEDPFVPDLEGYEPQGRAVDPTLGGPSSDHDSTSRRARRGAGHASPGEKSSQPSRAPKGEVYPPSERGAPFRQGSQETDRAISDAATAYHLDPNFMRSVASIESGMNPSSNANRATQYKGLYQVGHDEWRRFGNGGNIYSAQDNAMGGARLFDANRGQFRSHFGRDPTDAELYMMHQQGLGFYTRGAMTNIGGNPYPGMHGPQTHESFEAGWGHEVARRKAEAARLHPTPITGARGAPVGEPDVGPQSSIDRPFKVAGLTPPNWSEGDVDDEGRNAIVETPSYDPFDYQKGERPNNYVNPPAPAPQPTKEHEPKEQFKWDRA
jgi:hypothetical protein